MTRIRTAPIALAALVFLAPGCGVTSQIVGPCGLLSTVAEVATGPLGRPVVTAVNSLLCQDPTAGTGVSSVDWSRSGTFTGSSPTLGDGTPYELWRIEGEYGQTLTVEMSSDQFDTFLGFGQLLEGYEEPFRMLSSDDDGGGGTNSRLRITLPASGTYVIVANAYREGATGAYTVRVTGESGRSLDARTAVDAGATFEGSLGATDPSMDEVLYYRVYEYDGQSGSDVEVTVEADGFAPLLVVRGAEAHGEIVGTAQAETDGDATFRASFPADGPYLLYVTSVSGQEWGDFTVRVRLE